MISQVRHWAKKSETVVIAYNIVDNWRIKRRFASGDTDTTSGATHARFSVKESLDYIDRVFSDYLVHGGLSKNDLVGKTVLEIGPGDNFGVALRFLACGARRVVCLDKFFSRRDDAQQRKIYDALRETLEPQQRERMDQVLSVSGKIAFDEQRLLYVHGTGMETAQQALRGEMFDVIASRAVLEHLYDADAAFAQMDLLLRPGGRLIHKVDFRDHGMFSSSGLHPLTFLTVPEKIYRWMTHDSGKPNRKLIGYYRRKMSELAYGSRILVTQLVGRPELTDYPEDLQRGRDYDDALLEQVERIRARLDGQFRQMTDVDLMVAGIFLVGVKP